MKSLLLSGLGLTTLLLSGCASVSGPVPASIAFYSAPFGISQTANVKAEKRGEACMDNILGIVAVGDASIDTAKRNGGITKVASIEQAPLQIGSYYARYCTIVYGE